VAAEVGRLLNGLINRFQDPARENAAPESKPRARAGC
jgi:hypothetical protein